MILLTYLGLQCAIVYENRVMLPTESTILRIDIQDEPNMQFGYFQTIF
jgi:hypothetical protein